MDLVLVIFAVVLIATIAFQAGYAGGYADAMYDAIAMIKEGLEDE